MKNLLFHLKAVKTGTHKAQVGDGNCLKFEAGAGAEKNSFGSATLFSSLIITELPYTIHSMQMKVLSRRKVF
jgi:hypothetical protein